MSTSRTASSPHFGHLHFLNASDFAKGLFPSGLNSTSYGNNTGKSDSFTNTSPHFGQYTIGIGAPQYLCLETNQSFNLYFTVFFPLPISSNFFTICFLASSKLSPSNSPEFINFVFSLWNF